MADLSGSDEERAEAALVAAAGKILRRDNREVPEDFIAGLFALAAPEDIMRYDPRQLAGLAASAWSLMAVRKPGAPKIRFEAFESDIGPEWRQRESVLEIINDDMPFLVDSILAELSECGIDIRLIVHPVFAVARDADGRLTAFKGTRAAGTGLQRESFIHIHVARIDEEARRAQIVEGIELALSDVRAAVEDWRAMTARVAELITGLKANPPPLPVDEIAEAIAFLEWLAADNFTFLGTRGYAVARNDGALEPVAGSGLGLLRAPEVRICGAGRICSISRRKSSRSCASRNCSSSPSPTSARACTGAFIWTMSG